jgi:hypothetical protein
MNLFSIKKIPNCFIKAMLFFKRRLKMKTQKSEFADSNEMNILRSQVSPEDMFIIGFLKGFDRKTLKKWKDKEMMDFSIDFSIEPENLSEIEDELE